MQRRRVIIENATNYLCRTKVAQFDASRGRVEQQILRFNVSMADAQIVNVGQGSKQLVHIQLAVHWRNRLFRLIK